MTAPLHVQLTHPTLRHLEEMMSEGGVLVDHATVHHWAPKMQPVLASTFRKRSGNPVFPQSV
jgi:transposase-like protein